MGNPKTRKPESGFRNRKPESGNRKPESGNRKPETGNRKPVIRKSGYRNPESEIRNPESDTGIRNPESTNQSKQVLQIRKKFLAELLPVENKSSKTRTFRDAFDNEYYCAFQ